MGLPLIIACAGLAVLVAAIIALLFSDGDLTLMWAERFGEKADKLKGQVVWITGASSGIGRHIAYQLARVGCKLVLSARNTRELEIVKKECLAYGNLNDSDILVLPLDVTHIDAHSAATEKVLSTFGQIDVLVNNAGRTQRAWIVDTELAVVREMLELNVIAQISLTQCVLPHMISRRAGHIVLTASLAGKMPLPASAVYCLTKRATIGYFHCLALEMHSNIISVTVVCPGPVASNASGVAFTGKLGQTHDINQENDRKRMSTSRCAQLILVAMSNKLSEVWIAKQPPLTIAYLAQYCPTILDRIWRTIGVKGIEKIREGR